MPVLAHELLGAPPFVGHVPGAFGEGAEPEVQRAQRERADHDQQRVVDAVGVRHGAVEVEDGDRDDDDERERDLEQRTHRLGIARSDELAPRANERREDDQRDQRLFEVEALGEMGHRGRDDESHGQLPGAALAPGQAAREPEQPEAERERERPRDSGHPLGENAPDDPAPVGHLRGRRRDDGDETDERGRPCERQR